MTEPICCGSCCNAWREDELEPFHGDWSRVEPGGVVPVGDCPDPDCGSFCTERDAWTAANLILHLLDGHGEGAQHKIVQAIEAGNDTLALSLWNQGLDAWKTRDIAVSATESDAGMVLDRERLTQMQRKLATPHRPS